MNYSSGDGLGSISEGGGVGTFVSPLSAFYALTLCLNGAGECESHGPQQDACSSRGKRDMAYKMIKKMDWRNWSYWYDMMGLMRVPGLQRIYSSLPLHACIHPQALDL